MTKSSEIRTCRHTCLDEISGVAETCSNPDIAADCRFSDACEHTTEF